LYRFSRTGRRRSAFNPLTHLLVGWGIANVGPSTRASRTCCLVASLIPDVDGLLLPLGRDLFLKYHHQVTHNLLFAAVVAGVSSWWIGARPWQISCVFFCGLAHFLGDYYGSGPGWELPLFYPFSGHPFVNPDPWKFNGWQSQIVFVISLLVTIAIARFAARTPLESISTGLNTMFSDLAVLGFHTRCECGKRALYRCHQCRVIRCSEHLRFVGHGRVLCQTCLDSSRTTGREGDPDP